MEKAKTKCENCIFRKDKSCSLGRLEKFKENGAEVVYENDSAIVTGRFCSALRTKEWSLGKDKYNLEIILRSELLTTHEVIIYGNKFDENLCKKTIESLNKMLLKPKKVIFCLNDESEKVYPIIKLLNASGFEFRVDKINYDERGLVQNKLFALDISANKCESTHFIIIEQGEELDEELFANVDEAINEKLIRFIKVNYKNTAVYNTSIYKKLLGNSPVTESFLLEEENGEKKTILFNIDEKIKFLSEKDSHQYLIKEYEEIL
jgi:hypothetical protein